MKLNRVTLTGADDSVDPKELINLSKTYPEVEWGILFAGDGYGAPRFPSIAWIDKLLKLKQEASHKVNLCAHLCGQWIIDVFIYQKLHWDTMCPIVNPRAFKRIQLNTHGASLEGCDAPKFLSKYLCYQPIFQCDGTNDERIREEFVGKLHLGVPLFDTSSGAGLTPEELGEGWPISWPNVYCGYAGGLGPDNVVDQIKAIEPKAHGYIWIDMETKIRTRYKTEEGRIIKDVFDLDKVRSVLEQTKPYITP
jgi:hypothetical protein